MMTLEQDRTDPSIRPSQEPVPGVSPPPHASRTLHFVVAGCLIVSLLSLALSAFMLYSLLDVRRTAAEGLDVAISALDSFGDKGFQYEYPLNQEIPISADVPISQELNFPVEGTFPINTTVEVPIKAGMLGSFVIEMPIDTSVAVSTSVPIRLDESFHIETTVPVSMTIPIDIQPGDPAAQELLQGIMEWLLKLRDSI
ncbi:MAG: hypothetical protein ACK2UA_08445 [Anaerolineae bacterium]|jgi:hypothetical protein